jgi:hypothetical protein
MAFARIAITLPRDLLAATDRRAKELDRSRSRVVAEALRAYLARHTVVREASRSTYGADEFGAAARSQLQSDLHKTPAERLRHSEEVTRLARSLHPKRAARQQIIGFDSYDEFYEWKKSNRV